MEETSNPPVIIKITVAVLAVIAFLFCIWSVFKYDLDPQLEKNTIVREVRVTDINEHVSREKYERYLRFYFTYEAESGQTIRGHLNGKPKFSESLSLRYRKEHGFEYAQARFSPEKHYYIGEFVPIKVTEYRDKETKRIKAVKYYEIYPKREHRIETVW